MPRTLAFLFAALALVPAGPAADVAPPPRAKSPAVAPPPRDAGEPLLVELTIEDPGIDSDLTLPKLDRIEDVTLPPLPRPTGIAAPGLPDRLKVPGGIAQPVPKAGDPTPNSTFPGRSGATRAKLLKEYGGNEASEKAVESGLAWLARQQKQDGHWEYDGGTKDEVVAATGMALLAFLGSGEAHDGKGKYAKPVKNGLDFLLKSLPNGGANAGKFAGATNMYAQAIGTLALCEAYGLSKDKNLLAPAQAAVNYIQRSQGANGSWGYAAGNNGDTSIVGWQIQALVAARQAKDIVVEKKVIENALKFLDSVSKGSRRSEYGYTSDAGAVPGTALTAVGLWCRYNVGGWGPDNAGLADGVAGLMRRAPVAKDVAPDLYFHYYATRVVLAFDGEEWKEWNEGKKQADGTRKDGMRDWLVQLQVAKEGPNRGSWDADGGWIGRSCGRVGTTAMSVLILESYYRYPPLFKRQDGKVVEVEKP